MRTKWGKIVATILVTLATVMVVGHNLVPHHHDLTPCTDIFTAPCSAGVHSCAHASCEAHDHRAAQLDVRHDHSICTDVMEYLSSDRAPLSHVITVAVWIAEVSPPITDDTETAKIISDDAVPLLYEQCCGALSRRGPPAC